MSKPQVTLFWFRRDFRLEDNRGLYHAHQEENPVQPVFIFDTNILDELPKKDARVEFIHQEIERLQNEIQVHGGTMDVRVGKPIEIWKNLVEDYEVKTVWANRDYEPYARERDKEVYDFLSKKGIEFKAKKDHVIFEKDEVVKDNGDPYVVYTPYSKLWKKTLTGGHLNSFKSEEETNWNQAADRKIPSLKEIGFEPAGIEFPSRELNEKVVDTYDETRDIPAMRGTSRMSIHLRFGTVSIRELVRRANALNEKYLNELIWRDFYQAILWHFPQVVDSNFNRKYDDVKWRNNEEEFEKWKKGKTGYPIVDAGMRELNQTGFMHNRVRMIVASFLTKHLLIDWRWGEAYFAEKLLDYELASNNGGWQWAAGTGVDAQPYFRIFNPYSQTDKFDKDRKYINKWIPEIDTKHYPDPIVEHKAARERCLDVYKGALN
ncbi:cryptochrome/photolyase family protein [Ekhidna sp. To15]|uniref:cryptochrome/photolyase family protein n=1 Tax=Ekhidna sp. To15 TaxID=3395267 RepID=UPI003F51B166